MWGHAKILGTILAFAAGLAPAVAAAHCCCEGRHHTHWSRHARQWRAERFAISAGKPCGNYPASALRAHASGVTWLRIHVAPDGWVEAARVIRSSGRADLDRAAVACAEGWRLDAGYDWRDVQVTWRYHGAWWG